MKRKSMVICDRIEGIYYVRLFSLIHTKYPRRGFTAYGQKTANGIRYHYEVNLTIEEYNGIIDEVNECPKFFGLPCKVQHYCKV